MPPRNTEPLDISCTCRFPFNSHYRINSIRELEDHTYPCQQAACLILARGRENCLSKLQKHISLIPREPRLLGKDFILIYTFSV